MPDAVDEGECVAGVVGVDGFEALSAEAGAGDVDVVDVCGHAFTVQRVTFEQALQFGGVALGECLTGLVAVEHFGEVKSGLVLAVEAFVVQYDGNGCRHQESFA